MFNAKTLEKLKQKLLDKRSAILNRTGLEEHLKLSTDDLADESDHAAAVIQQGVALEVAERERRLLLEIDNALAKFEDGTYGFCEDTGEPIEAGRLDAQPWTRYCVEAAELREHKARRYAR
jgi:DnaK suppressor protein